MKQTYILLICFLAFFQLQIIAEEEEVFGIILYAEGHEITLYQNDGSVEVYDVMYDNIIGEPLYEGESIETDAGSFVEIQLYPSENILKLSESTALTFESMLGSTGGSVLSLVSGSIRAKVERLLGDDSFDIRTGETVAGVRGTDFGVDYLYDETEDAYITDVICFEGEIEVREQEETESSVRYRIGPDEQMSVRPQPGGPLAFNQKPMPEDRKEFWQLRDFREAPIGPGFIDNRFPGLRDKMQTDVGLRRLAPEQRNQPGFQGIMPQKPMRPGQSGNQQAPTPQQRLQQNTQQNSNTQNNQQPEKRKSDSGQNTTRNRS